MDISVQAFCSSRIPKQKYSKVVLPEVLRHNLEPALEKVLGGISACSRDSLTILDTNYWQTAESYKRERKRECKERVDYKYSINFAHEKKNMAGPRNVKMILRSNRSFFINVVGLAVFTVERNSIFKMWSTEAEVIPAQSKQRQQQHLCTLGSWRCIGIDSHNVL